MQERDSKKQSTGPSRDDEGSGAHSEHAPSAQRTVRREIAGPAGPEPTRYGDWERGGRCIDF